MVILHLECTKQNKQAKGKFLSPRSDCDVKQEAPSPAFASLCVSHWVTFWTTARNAFAFAFAFLRVLPLGNFSGAPCLRGNLLCFVFRVTFSLPQFPEIVPEIPPKSHLSTPKLILTFTLLFGNITSILIGEGGDYSSPNIYT